MVRLNAYKTKDGNVFTSYGNAHDHANEEYGAALAKLARELVQIDKYVDMLKALQDHLESFKELIALKDDIELKAEEEDND